MQNSKKGLLLFGFGVVFLSNNVIGHLWRDITLGRYPMPLQWIALSMYLLCCRNNEWILVFFLIRALGGCQTYTLVSLENEGLYVCESL